MLRTEGIAVFGCISLCYCGICFQTHPLLEAHGGDVTPDGRVLLVAATERLFVEEALGDGLLESRAHHFIHMHRAHTFKTQEQRDILNFWVSPWTLCYHLLLPSRESLRWSQGGGACPKRSHRHFFNIFHVWCAITLACATFMYIAVLINTICSVWNFAAGYGVTCYMGN